VSRISETRKTGIMTTEDAYFDILYKGDKGPLFKLAFKTGLLSLVTLGIYRFWAKTRIRKYIWSSVDVGGDTFEYTGTGIEKLLGFLVAIVFLAVYVGLVQMALFYAGLNIMVDPETASPQEVMGQMGAIYITFFAVLPFLLFAIYRARRYKMARTRWRGIRFGMNKGAWGYVWRALGYGLLSAITLGALTPLSTFKLEKYMADRSYYGTARFCQHGKWTALYPAFKHVLIGIGILIAGAGLIALGMSGTDALVIIGGIGVAVGYIWVIIGSVYYSVRAFGYLTSHKVLSDEISFSAFPRTAAVIKTYILGGLLLSLLVSVVFGIVGILGASFIPMLSDTPSTVEIVVYGGILGIGYLVALVLTQALSLITQPIMAHYIRTVTIQNASALNRIAQREAETGVDAEGFADALDIGGAI
jgi:hypothetical protein